MNDPQSLPRASFLATLEIVHREGRHLAYSWQRLFAEPLAADWVRGLDERPEQAERLEAFVSRFGRMQDTLGEKFLLRWLMALAERPGSLIETLNRTERLGVLENVESWLEARELRNLLVHEYMTGPEEFAVDLNLAKDYSRLLIGTYNRLREFWLDRMNMQIGELPDRLDMPHASADH